MMPMMMGAGPMPGQMPGMRPPMQPMGFPGMPGMRPMMPGMRPQMGFPGAMPGYPYAQPGQPTGPSAVTGEPPAKKSRKTAALIPEAQFKSAYPKPVTISVLVPSDPARAEWEFKGQMLSFTVSVSDGLKALKGQIASHLNSMPVKKMKLSFQGGMHDGTFLNKDSMSLAHYNVGPGSTLKLGVKERGGRRK